MKRRRASLADPSRESFYERLLELHEEAAARDVSFVELANAYVRGDLERVHLTTTQAARRAGVCHVTVIRAFDRGELDGYRTAGGHRRVLGQSLEAWIRTRAAGTRRGSRRR